MKEEQSLGREKQQSLGLKDCMKEDGKLLKMADLGIGSKTELLY